MALEVNELSEMRRRVCDNTSFNGFIKPQINAALQAVEDFFELPATKTAISNAINGATAPATMTALQKRYLVKIWLEKRAGRY